MARMFTRPALFESMTAAENVMVAQHRRMRGGFFACGFGLALSKHDDRLARRHALELLELLGIEDAGRPAGGRPGPGGAAAGRSGPGPGRRPPAGHPRRARRRPGQAERKELAERIGMVCDEMGIAVLVTGQDFPAIAGLADFVYVLDTGSVVGKGEPDEVAADTRVQAAFLRGVQPFPPPEAPPRPAEPTNRRDGPAGGQLMLTVAPGSGWPTATGPSSTGSTSRWATASPWPCSAPTGPGRRRSPGRSPASSGPRAGTITFDGRRLDRLSPRAIVRAGVAGVPQGRRIFAGLTVLDNLRVGASTRGRQGRRATSTGRSACSRACGAWPTGRRGPSRRGSSRCWPWPGRWSAGRNCCVVDEISAGVSPALAVQLFDVLRGLSLAGVALLVIDQFVNLALGLADRAIVIENGRVSVSSEPARLVSADVSWQSTHPGGGDASAKRTKGAPG